MKKTVIKPTEAQPEVTHWWLSEEGIRAHFNQQRVRESEIFSDRIKNLVEDEKRWLEAFRNSRAGGQS